MYLYLLTVPETLFIVNVPTGPRLCDPLPCNHENVGGGGIFQIPILHFYDVEKKGGGERGCTIGP